MTATFDYATEHLRGLHREFKPSGCEACTASLPPVEPAAISPMRQPEETPAAVGNLGPALRKITSRIVVDQADDDQGAAVSPTPDGNPWCEECHGARVLAVRKPRTATTYDRCPACKTAPWAIQARVDRLVGTLPPRFAAWRLDTFPTPHPAQQDVLQIARAWLQDTSPSWLFAWGPTGRGKTGLAVGLLYELALAGSSTALAIVPDLMTTIKATFGGPEGETESSILETLCSVDALCLDDLGAEYHRGPEDWAAEKIFQIIAARHAAFKRTIITSNHSLDTLQDKLGHPRTLRRITDMTTTRWIIDFRGLPLVGGTNR